MWNSKKSVTLSLAVCIAVSVVIVAVAVAAPFVMNSLFIDLKMTDSAFAGALICFYPAAVLGEFALYCLVRMLLNIRNGQTFVDSNVRCLRRISWCCFGAAALMLVGTVFYVPFAVIAAAAGFIGLILRVVKNVMQSAIELREENDLTI